MLTSSDPSMNYQQTYCPQPTFFKSPACTTASEQEHTSSEFQLALTSSPHRHQYSQIQETISSRRSPSTDRPLENQKEDGFVLDLIINGRSLEIRVECQEFWKIEKEIEDVFRKAGIREKMYRPLKLVVFQQLASKYSTFQLLLHKQAQKYGQAILDRIDQLLDLESFQYP